MRKLALVCIGLLLSLLLLTSPVLADGGEYDIGRFVVSGGGGERSSEHYAIRDVVGQPALGHSESQHFVLKAGFLSPLQAGGSSPTPTPTPSTGVGGSIVPTDRLALVTPWLVAAALVVVTGALLLVWNRKRGTERTPR